MTTVNPAIPPGSTGIGSGPSPIGSTKALSPQTMAATTAISSMADIPSQPLHDEEIISSDDDNMHGHSNSSSVQVTPAKKRTRFTPSKSTPRSLASSQTTTGSAGETSVLSCQLALLAALTAEMESSVNIFEKEQWQTRIFQVNQIMQMVQWEANGLYGLAAEGS